MRRRPRTPDQAPDSALARLLEVESRLEAMLDAVRVETDARVRDAEDLARAREDGLAAELAAAEQELAAAVAAESEARIVGERSRLDARRALYDGVDEGQARALAARVVDDVLRTAAGAAR